MTPSRDISRLLEIMAALRTPETGCPWDLEQDFSSIAPYTIEEAYEVADAIERGDMEDLRLELGDLLLQAVYHARMAEEDGHFDFGDVVAGITQKMIRRHPHVFGGEDNQSETYSAEGMAQQTWERIKAEEKAEDAKRRQELGLPTKSAGHSHLDPVPATLPGLTQAEKLQKKAASVGFDWPDIAPVIGKLQEEIDELKEEIEIGSDKKIEGEVGDLLFSVVNLARHLSVDPEAALRRTNRKFRDRFSYLETNLAKAGETLEQASLERMDRLWEESKQAAVPEKAQRS